MGPFVDLVDDSYVRVIERRRRFRLVNESLLGLSIGFVTLFGMLSVFGGTKDHPK
jgi:hypothetical protein